MMFLKKEGHICTVPNRTRETLLPIILKYVPVGTIVFTDSARVYNCLSDLGYRHFTVNHSVGEYVNRFNNATTNHVESVWQKVKTYNKLRYGTHRTTLDSHLSYFMWIQKFGKDFEVFIDHIKLYS